MIPTQPPSRPANDPFVEATTTTSAVTRNASPFGRMALAGLLVAAVAGGAFAVRRSLAEPAGPQSPEEAVTGLFTALDNEDFLGVAEVLLPSERESMVEPGLQLLSELQRVEIIADDFDPSAASDFDITVADLSLSVEQVDPRLARVTTTGGSVTIADMTVGELPIGSALSGFDIDQSEVLPGEENDLEDAPAHFTVVEDDGSWYVSLWYSVAEEARREADAPFPGLGNGPAPVGSERPDEVLEVITRGLLELDAETVLTQLDPEEAAALYDYSPLFLDDLDEAAEDVEAFASDYVTWSLEDVDFTAFEHNGRTVVNPRSIALRGTVLDSTEPLDFFVAIDGSCVDWTVGDETGEYCPQEDPSAEALDLPPEATELLDRISGIRTGITVVERDGRWFLSVVPSVLHVYSDILAGFEPGDVDLLQSLTEDLGQLGTLGGFGPTGELPPVDLQPNGGGFGGQDLGPFEGKLVGDRFAFVFPAGDSYLAYATDAPVAPGSLSVSFNAGDASFEITHFAGGVPAIFDEWTRDETKSGALGVPFYVDEWGFTAAAVVGDYVVVDTFFEGEVTDEMFEQVELLRTG